jgi:hypothetical protein
MSTGREAGGSAAIPCFSGRRRGRLFVCNLFLFGANLDARGGDDTLVLPPVASH